MSGGDGNSRISKSKKFLLPQAGGSCGRVGRVMGAQEPGSPTEAGSTGACQMATGATEEMQGLLEKPSETVRGETYPACPSYPTLHLPAGWGEGCSLRDPSQKSAKPATRKH